nr:hypothetical protein K-LCC10_0199 [Kaumoebavirus]
MTEIFEQSFEALNHKKVGEKISADYPFVRFNYDGDKIYSINIDGFVCFPVLRCDTTSKKLSVSTFVMPSRDVLTDDDLERLLVYYIKSNSAFHTGLLSRRMDKLEKMITEIHTMLSCAPGGPEYEKAKTDFESKA